MANVLLPLLPGTLPPGVCYPDEQSRLNAFMAVSNAILNGQAFYNYGDTKPDVSLQSYPWLRTTDMLWYQFVGVWRRPRPVLEQDPDYRIWWAGLEANIPLVGGGDNGIPSPTSGPFWARDTDFDGRSPMCPGTIPSANPAKALSVGENYGEGAHVGTIAELATHTHPPATNFSNFAGFVSPGQPSTFEITGGTEVEKMGLTGETGGGEASPVIHPVRGLWCLKPTNRLYYVVP